MRCLVTYRAHYRVMAEACSFENVCSCSRDYWCRLSAELRTRKAVIEADRGSETHHRNFSIPKSLYCMHEVVLGAAAHRLAETANAARYCSTQGTGAKEHFPHSDRPNFDETVSGMGPMIQMKDEWLLRTTQQKRGVILQLCGLLFPRSHDPRFPRLVCEFESDCVIVQAVTDMLV